MNEDEIKARLDIIDWVIQNMRSLDLCDKMVVLHAMMKLADLLEHIYKKYNGKVFFVDLGGDE